MNVTFFKDTVSWISVENTTAFVALLGKHTRQNSALSCVQLKWSWPNSVYIDYPGLGAGFKKLSHGFQLEILHHLLLCWASIP